MGAGAAAWAAAEAPDVVSQLVLIGPFVRNVPLVWWKKALIETDRAHRLRRPVGTRRLGRLLRLALPFSQARRLRRLQGERWSQISSEPGRMAALQAMLRASKDDVEARLGDIRAPTLVVMGSKDPDFDDPAAEAATIAGLLHGQVVMMEGAGHYPHAEMPDDGRRRDPRVPRAAGRLMPRAGLTPEIVVADAAAIADAEGLDAVTFARLAERLNVKRAVALQARRQPRRRAPGAGRARHRGSQPTHPGGDRRQVARRRPVRPRPRLLEIRPGTPRALRRLAARRQARRERHRQGRRSADRNRACGARRLRRQGRRRTSRDAGPACHHPRLRLARRRRRLSPEARPRRILRSRSWRLRPRSGRPGRPPSSRRSRARS